MTKTLNPTNHSGDATAQLEIKKNTHARAHAKQWHAYIEQTSKYSMAVNVLIIF
jgi:hypothetical protein